MRQTVGWHVIMLESMVILLCFIPVMRTIDQQFEINNYDDIIDLSRMDTME